MNTRQKEKHTYIKVLDLEDIRGGLHQWYLFDNVKKRRDFEFDTKKRYEMCCNIKIGQICPREKSECIVARDDESATLIDMRQYLALALFLKCNGEYKFNKKLNKLIKIKKENP